MVNLDVRMLGQSGQFPQQDSKRPLNPQKKDYEIS